VIIFWDAGKSSQIPKFLLEENMEPILCTQPRRLAVVAIARTVAKALDCDVGEDVGYHIGHSNVSNLHSKRYLSFLSFYSVNDPVILLFSFIFFHDMSLASCY
jgi:hypothetical protein